MRRKDVMKKGTAWLLVAALLVGLLPIAGTPNTVQAETGETTETTTAKTIAGLGTGVIADPTAPSVYTDAWKGSYVYFGNYDSSPVKYRVLDANTTRFSKADDDGNKAETMLLDSDKILYDQEFDNDGKANEGYTKANDWAGSDVKNSLNGTDFLNKDGVFTTVEKGAIAQSTIAAHALTTESTEDGAVNVASWIKDAFANYVPLTGEKVFLLDAEDVSNNAYGYSTKDGSCGNRKKSGGWAAYWWLRSADGDRVTNAGYVYLRGDIQSSDVSNNRPGVSPALNLNLSSVIFTSVISGTSGETGAEYKLTLKDSDMSIAPKKGVTKSGNTMTIPYTISGTNSDNATQVSVLVLDKEYTAGNTNGAKVLDYQKLSDVNSTSTSGSGTYTFPDSLSGKAAGTDYHVYILAEDVNDEKETDYASEPVEIHLWEAPTVSAMNFGTDNIIDPAVPLSTDDKWTGCYVYYGNYNGSPVKYRVLDAETTDFSGSTKTMLLDCDSVLEKRAFDAGINVWYGSDINTYLNGEFLTGNFSVLEQDAIVASTKANANASDGKGWSYANYAALGDDKIFLLDAKEATRISYGYSDTDERADNRIKNLGSSAVYWWLRSADSHNGNCAGYVHLGGDISSDLIVDGEDSGVSPALNLNLSSVILTSANVVSKSSPLTSDSEAVGTTTGTEWKLTLKDSGKAVALTEERSATKASNGTITVPYTYTDTSADDAEAVNQISVMITDKAYDSTKTAGEQEAKILYYGALDDIKNAEGTKSTVAETKTGTGTFALPSGLTGKLGTDYHIYLLAEHVSTDDSTTADVNEALNTDYASEPLKVTTILDEIDTVAIPSVDTPTPEQAFATEITISSTEVAEKATLTWKKVTSDSEEKATGNAEWKTTYNAYVTLTAKDGYTFKNAKGNISTVTYGEASADEDNSTSNGTAVEKDKITLNDDGTLTVCVGAFTTATRKTTGVTAPEVPEQFANYYTTENVLGKSNTEMSGVAKVTLEGTTTPNPVDMAVTWEVVDTDGNDATYDPTPEATNTFRWTVKESEYKDKYDVSALTEKEPNPFTGTVTIKNKDYTPVTITGEDKKLTYDGSKTLDVSKYFTIDGNAGKATYELLGTSTGNGAIEGSVLTIESTGTFVIKVSTATNGIYGKGEHTLTLTIEKAEPTISVAPTVADRTYHPNVALVNEDLITTDAKVVGKAGETLTGTWSVKKVDGSHPVPQADNEGYAVVFTPDKADAIFYTAVEGIVKVNVAKATPHVKTPPTATDITYGKSLADAALSGGVVTYGESDSETDSVKVEGTFTWKKDDTTDPFAIKPTVADSGKTEYVAVFNPVDTSYNTVETKITLTVNKAAVAPDKPETSMDTIYINDTVEKVILPENWVWQETDKTKALEVGKAATATAIYNGADKGNYVTESVEVSITRLACTHTWDDGVVTKEPTATTKGEKLHTCTVCKATKTEEVAALGAPKVGAESTSDDGTATYKVTVSDLTNGEATYIAPANKKSATVIIPDTVVIDGVTYKVTAVEKNAFKNNKYIKKLIIGNNVKTIGKSAFAGCKKLKTVKFGKSVTTISDKAFYKCAALTKIIIPSKVKTIGKSAFEGCKKLKSVTIGKSVSKIGAKAFYGCKELKSINIKTKKLTAKKVGKNAFKGVGSKYYKKIAVKVPSKKYVNKYRKMLQSRGLSKKAKVKK